MTGMTNEQMASAMGLFALGVGLVWAWAVIACGSEGAQSDFDFPEQPTRRDFLSVPSPARVPARDPRDNVFVLGDRKSDP